MLSVFVVIVNFRTGPLVIDCLSSLAADSDSLGVRRVVVVDNLSGDDSVSSIRTAIRENGWESWAEVLALPRNGGFAYGNNAGIRRVRELDGSFHTLLLLNPDTVVVAGAVASLVQFLHAHPDAGIVGASIEDESGRMQPSAHGDPSPIRELERGAQLGLLTNWLVPRTSTRGSDVPYLCDWVSGACMAIRRQVLDEVGDLDEGFFLYFEEVDFCVRARLKGWSCWFVPGARVVHFEGASTGIKNARRLPGYWYASRRRFFVKRFGVHGLIVADILWTVGRLSLVLRRILGLGGRKHRQQEPTRLVFDLIWGDLCAMLTGSLRRIARHEPKA